MENLRNKIISTLIERAPNPLTLDNFFTLLPNSDMTALAKEIQTLMDEGAIQERSSPRNKDYRLPSYEHIPIKEYISIAGVKVPRALAGDTARSESVNIFFETLARRLIEVEANAEKKLDERLKSYWGNIVTLFGAFIGVFSLIVGFLKTIPIEKDATFLSVLSLGTAQVLPFAFVLAGFVWFLKWQFK